MKETKGSYATALKSTTFFGGVQVIQILVQLIRSKFIAVLLGPSGIGFFGLITATLSMMESLTNCGVGTSAVKSIAHANHNDPDQLGKTVGLVRRLIWITGSVGALLTLLLSPLLSKLTFGNYQYTSAFLLVGGTILFNQLYAGNLAQLQGIRANRSVGNTTLFVSIFSLLIVLPLYYFFGQQGILPGMIATALINFGYSLFVVHQNRIPGAVLPIKQVLTEGKPIIVMGIMVSLGGLLALGSSYLLRVFINYQDGFSAVGLYNSGFAIINTYVGLVFTAMSLDYFPRLSGMATDFSKLRELVNQQAEISMLILGPIIGVFILGIDHVTILLYSKAFLPVMPMLFWASLGVLFKSTSWCMSYIFLAKSDNRVFFWNELLSNLVFLGLNFAGYSLLKLEGLGMAFLLAYILYFIQIYLVVHFRYAFRLDTKFLRVFLFQLVVVMAIMFVKHQQEGWVRYVLGALLVTVSLVFSIQIIGKQVAFNSLIARFKSKF